MKTRILAPGIGFLFGFLALTAGAQSNCISLAQGGHFVAGSAILYTNGVLHTPTLPANSRILKPNAASGTFITYINEGGLSGWMPLPAAPTPGFGWIISVPTACSLCFSDSPPAATLPLNLVPGFFNMVCATSFRTSTFEDIVGRAPDPGTQLLKYIGSGDLALNSTNYLIYTFNNGVWSPSEPTVAPGEAVWVVQPPKIVNLQFGAGVFQFQTLTVPSASIAVEYSDTLDTPSWQTLTNLTGWGELGTVMDDTSTNIVGQRFYRLNLPMSLP